MAWWHIFRRRLRGPKTEWLVAGLGNPGPEYATSRHNFGFIATEALARRCSSRWSRAGDGTLERCHGRLTGGTAVTVVRPLTYMNRSGEPLGRELERAGLSPARLIVLVDDLALPLGRMRIRAGGGHGGHNGLRSMIRELGTGAFTRIRLGVAPSGGMPPAGEWVDHVLGPFTGEEMEMVARVSEQAAEAVETIIVEGVSQAMGRFNRRTIVE